MGCHQERSSHELLKGGAWCDTVEAAVFVSGVLLLERLTQQTHNSRAIKGHTFLTLVWFSFLFFFFFLLCSCPPDCNVVFCRLFSFFITSQNLNYTVHGSQGKWVAVRVYWYIRFVWNFPGFFCHSYSLQIVQICSCSCVRKTDSRCSSQKEIETLSVHKSLWAKFHLVRGGPAARQTVSANDSFAMKKRLSWMDSVLIYLFRELCGLAHSQGCFLFLV